MKNGRLATQPIVMTIPFLFGLTATHPIYTALNCYIATRIFFRNQLKKVLTVDHHIFRGEHWLIMN